jgi:hypothetical protein
MAAGGASLRPRHCERGKPIKSLLTPG